jgi:hypothetical protein
MTSVDVGKKGHEKTFFYSAILEITINAFQCNTE